MSWMANAATAAQSGNFTYIETNNGTTITITACSQAAVGLVEIPATIDSKPVTTIGTSAFFNCTGITGVTIPSGVTTIGTNAFVRCLGMTTVSIPLTVSTIGLSAFANCTTLKKVIIPPGVTRIEKSTFNTCSALAGITIPASVTFIGDQAFQNCGALTSLTIPANVTTLNYRALSNCRKLTTLAIPASLISIGSEAFGNCQALTSISVDAANPNYSSQDGVLFDKNKTKLLAFPPGLGGGYAVPAGVTSIGSNAFLTCEKLIGITFPPSLVEMEPLAVSTCMALLYANFTGAAPSSVNFNSFQVTADGFTVYYLNGAAAGFAVYPWSEDKNTPVNMGENNSATTGWLLSEGLPAHLNLQSDPNSDGINLLLAYALNLHPLQNLSAIVPKPMFTPAQASISYWSGAAGISYRFEWSNDLMNWSTNGVTVSGPDANQMRTAWVPFSGQTFYVRLAVSN